MSHVLKDKMGKGLKKGAKYKPGEHSYDLKLVNEIVEQCETILLGEHDETVAFITNAVPKQLDYIKHFDQDAFLEAIVVGWQQNVDYNNLHFALIKSIEALHSAEITTSNLNLNIVPEKLDVMFANLKGTEESPIDITCKGNFKQFGSRVEYCNLNQEGYVRSFGQGAKFSILRFSGPPEYPFSAGWGAEDSAYYLPLMAAMPFTLEACKEYYEDAINYNRNDPKEFMPVSERCRFYVENDEISETWLFNWIKSKGFWEHKNRLYVPNGKGGWNERIPDGDGWNDGWKEVPE